MKWLTPLVLHSVLPKGIEGFKNISNDDIQLHANQYREFLAGYVME